MNAVDSYLGEIRMFSGNYAPEGWSLCDGSLLSVSENNILFSLLGTIYGGDGITTFGLPDLCGRLPIGQGQGAGLTQRVIAQTGGTETVTLDATTIPVHTHAFNTLAAAATTGTLSAKSADLTYAQGANGVRTYLNNAAPSPTSATLDPDSVTYSGPNQTTPHQNMMPSFTINFVICIEGLYPQRP